MGRQPSQEQEQAKQFYLDSNGEMPLVEIARQVGKSDGLIRKWKSNGKWDDELGGKGNVTKSNGNVTKSAKGNVTKSEPKERGVAPPKKTKRGAQEGNQNAKGHGAPLGNDNAVGNNGGPPPGNQNAVTHGFFRKFFPDDAETHEIFDNSDQLGAADMIWLMIRTKFTAIIRAQKLMFVADQDDLSKEVRKEQRFYGEDGLESDVIEYEVQYAWDKHAKFLNAQARAMSELRSLIKQFREMTGEDDKRRLELERMSADLEKTRAEIEKIKNGPGVVNEGLQIAVDYGDGES